MILKINAISATENSTPYSNEIKQSLEVLRRLCETFSSSAIQETNIPLKIYSETSNILESLKNAIIGIQTQLFDNVQENQIIVNIECLAKVIDLTKELQTLLNNPELAVLVSGLATEEIKNNQKDDSYESKTKEPALVDSGKINKHNETKSLDENENDSETTVEITKDTVLDVDLAISVGKCESKTMIQETLSKPVEKKNSLGNVDTSDESTKKLFKSEPTEIETGSLTLQQELTNENSQESQKYNFEANATNIFEELEESSKASLGNTFFFNFSVCA